MIVEAIWALGILASVSTIHLTLAWAEYPPTGTDFDRPLTRALVNALGWAVLAMIMIFAVLLNGIVLPPLCAGLIWATWRIARRRMQFRSLYWTAGPLGFLGLISVVALFQIVFGDNFFGLANIFPKI